MPSTQRSADRSAALPAEPTGSARPSRLPAWVLLLGGLIGEVAALALSVEKFRLAADPEYIPSCDLNPVLSCGSIMDTPQASAFGIPNSLLGVAGFAVLTAVGAALLAGAHMRAWFWAGLQAGVIAGFVFVHWLIFQSLYVIGALCPYCMAVWVVTAAVFWYVTLASLNRWVRPGGPRRVVDGLVAYHAVPVVAWVCLVAALIVLRFWEFWRTLL